MMRFIDTLSRDFASSLSGFPAAFAGLAFETLPFLLIGTFLASLLAEFLPDRMIRRILPRNRALSIAGALFVGAFLPVCECAIVPLAKRLRDKGVPTSSALAFLLAAPIVNPVSIASTVLAFRGLRPGFFAYRLGVGLASAFLVALIVELATGSESDATEVMAKLSAGSPDLESARTKAKRGMDARLLGIMHSCADDFLDSSRYLIGGVAAAALARGFLGGISASGRHIGALPSIALGEAAAYVLSLCSSADAFVARSLFAPRSYPAALAFLVLGPMMDLKNTILLARFIPPRRLLALMALVFGVSGLLCLAASAAWGLQP
jgi:uncharacterized membrane protein YraQ (UPF0718 family)